MAFNLRGRTGVTVGGAMIVVAIVLAASIVIRLAARDDGSQAPSDPVGPVVTLSRAEFDSLKPTATAHPAVRTTDERANRVIEALAAGDVDTLLALSRYEGMPCQGPPQDNLHVWARPLCPPGVAVDTPFQAIRAIWCGGGGPVTAEAFGRGLSAVLPSFVYEHTLVRTGSESPPYAPEAELIIAYILPDELHLAQFFLDEDGRIIALQGECSLDLSRQAEGERRLERVTIEIRRRRSQP